MNPFILYNLRIDLALNIYHEKTMQPQSPLLLQHLFHQSSKNKISKKILQENPTLHGEQIQQNSIDSLQPGVTQ